ncbi:MAG: oligopeptide transporter, OPT family, partial [Silvibacterium sp.]|nr:oligopeptide transporter, OPT family [Silvibacterium sp.]
EVSPGSLYASGLIAAGGIMGLLGVARKLYEAATGNEMRVWFAPSSSLYQLLYRQPLSVVMFAALAFSLYHFARKPLNGK